MTVFMRQREDQPYLLVMKDQRGMGQTLAEDRDRCKAKQFFVANRKEKPLAAFK